MLIRWLPVLVLVAGCASRDTEPAIDTSPAAEVSRPAAPEYVGDEACADCHGDLYRSYHRTGMGRSVTRFDPENAPERFDGETTVYNEPFNLYYEVFVRDDTLYQREYRLDDAGEVIHEQIHPAAWVIGSGNATRSYLMNVKGHVTEMPLTWYVDRQTWDLSPGYEQQNFRFSRPILSECMTCHNGRPEHSRFTQAHYTEVPLGITCERCHGPGGEHVEDRLAGFDPPEGEPDSTIVTPAHLSRDLQLAVCQQCHLTGTTVFKPSEDPMTYRPGTPLAAHRTVFATTDQLRDPQQFGIASHAQRLAQSACFEMSDMTCTTCHDPHQPVAELETDHFNQVCQSCHTPEPEREGGVCGREEAHSVEEAMTGDCVSCHMQTSGTSDIPHVTFTDHWIRRTLPPARHPDEIQRMLVRSRPFDLVRVSGDTSTSSSPQDQLEEAIAYFSFYETRHEHQAYLHRTIDHARAGLAAGADHVDARLALGRALMELDSLDEAQQVFEEAASRYPNHARVQYWLGALLEQRGRAEQALAPLGRATELQPAFTEAHFKLAEALNASGRTNEAEAAYREVVRQDPVHHPEAWNNLGFLYLQSQRLDEAAEALQRAVELEPDLVAAFVNLGSVRMMQQAYPEATRLFERAIRVDSAYAPAFGNLGIVYAQMGRYDEARTMLERVLELQPGDQRARAVLNQIDQVEGGSEP